MCAVAAHSGTDGNQITESMSWNWRGHSIGYLSAGPQDGTPVVLIHGFGVSSGTYRKTMPALASAGHRAYAIDLLGFGRSSKATDVTYSTDLWRDQVIDFCKDFAAGRAVFLVGNSFGSLVAMSVAATAWGQDLDRVRGIIMLNCGGGMNSKFLSSSRFVPPVGRLFLGGLFAVLDALLNFRPFVSYLFESLASKDAVTQVLQGVYTQPSQVDSELVEGILAPARDEGALDVFVKVLVGDPGKAPDDLFASVNCPIKLVWGEPDTVTPLQLGYGKYFQDLAAASPQVSMSIIDAGHVPQDDKPEVVHAIMLPWISHPPDLTPASVQEQVRRRFLSLLQENGGDTTASAVQEALDALVKVNPTPDASLKGSYLDADWLQVSKPEYPGMLREKVYTLDRLSFGVYAPKDMQFRIDRTVQPIRCQEGEDDVRGYDTAVELTCVDERYPPFKAVMYNFGQMKPARDADGKDSRLDVWFTGGYMTPAEGMDSEMLQQWKDIFATAMKQEKEAPALSKQATNFFLDLTMGFEPPGAVESDGKITYAMKTAPHGYVDILYLDDTLRVTRGNRGSVVAVTR